MPKAFTAKTIEHLKPGPSRKEIPDGAMPGLYVIVQPSGIKSFAYRYRLGTKWKKLTLGRFPTIGVADARRAAAEAQESVRGGGDPAAAKRAAKAARREELLSERDTVRALIDLYSERHLSKLKTGEAVRKELERNVLPVWGERKIQEVSRRDMIELLEAIAASGRATTANRVRAYLSKFCGWCVDREILEISPALGVKALAKEQSRDRVFLDHELRLFWRACDDVGEPWGCLGQFLLLTGTRLREATNMTDEELIGDVWTLPAQRSKNGRAHELPLSRKALAIATRRYRVPSEAGLVFSTNGRTGISGFTKGRARISHRMNELASLEAGKPVELPHWTFHDLRRTAATRMAGLGIPVAVIESALNHVSGAHAGVAGIYNRHTYAEEKRRAFQAWARLLEEIASGESAGNVTRLDLGR